MVHYIQPALLVDVCNPETGGPPFASTLVEVVAIVLDNEVGGRYVLICVNLYIICCYSLFRTMRMVI